jgi:hypothetical protein
VVAQADYRDTASVAQATDMTLHLCTPSSSARPSSAQSIDRYLHHDGVTQSFRFHSGISSDSFLAEYYLDAFGSAACDNSNDVTEFGFQFS